MVLKALFLLVTQVAMYLVSCSCQRTKDSFDTIAGVILFRPLEVAVATIEKLTTGTLSPLVNQVLRKTLDVVV